MSFIPNDFHLLAFLCVSRWAERINDIVFERHDRIGIFKKITPAFRTECYAYDTEIRGLFLVFVLCCYILFMPIQITIIINVIQD